MSAYCPGFPTCVDRDVTKTYNRQNPKLKPLVCEDEIEFQPYVRVD